jgi:hypothetical protein
VLPQDAPYLEAWNELNSDRPERQVSLDYPPEPFIGVHDAPLVLLEGNPRLGDADSQTWTNREVVDRALESVTSAQGTSFFWLHDGLEWTEGAKWWRPRTAALRKVRADLANRILTVEFHGYHSRNWQALPITLPSQPYNFGLVEQAMDREAVIVVMRAWREWQVAVPGLARYARLVLTSSKQASYITPGNIRPADKWSLICQAVSQGSSVV